MNDHEYERIATVLRKEAKRTREIAQIMQAGLNEKRITDEDNRTTNYIKNLEEEASNDEALATKAQDMISARKVGAEHE